MYFVFVIKYSPNIFKYLQLLQILLMHAIIINMIKSNEPLIIKIARSGVNSFSAPLLSSVYFTEFISSYLSFKVH